MQPRAKRDEIVSEREGVLVVRVTAPPVEGKANAALCALLARRLHIPKAAVTIVKGHGAREKVVRIEGMGRTDVQAALLG